MAYTIVLRDEARRAFARLDRAVQKQVQRTIDRLAENPRPGQATQLVGDPRDRAQAVVLAYESGLVTPGE